MASGSFGRYRDMIKDILKSEQIADLPEAAPGQERVSFASRIFAAESLPFDEAPRAVRSPARGAGLFASEELPFDPPAGEASGRRSFLSRLFSHEQLPCDPVPGPGAGRGPGG